MDMYAIHGQDTLLYKILCDGKQIENKNIKKVLCNNIK